MTEQQQQQQQLQYRQHRNDVADKRKANTLRLLKMERELTEEIYELECMLSRQEAAMDSMDDVYDVMSVIESKKDLIKESKRTRRTLRKKQRL